MDGPIERQGTVSEALEKTQTRLAVPDGSVRAEPLHRTSNASPRKRLVVVSGSSHPELAGRIADHLGVGLGARELETSTEGECYCRYDDSVRGADMFIVQRPPGPSPSTWSSS